MKKIILIWLVIVFSSFATVSIKDEANLCAKEFIKNWETKYPSKEKEIVVLTKKTIGKETPVVYGSNYFRENDLGGKNGTGVIILIIMDIRTIQVITGYKVEEIFTDYQTDVMITSKIIKNAKLGKYEEAINEGLLNSIKILDEVIK